VLNAAIDFGLTREEAWRTFSDALSTAHVETVPDYYDAIAGALAQEILFKQRRILAS
jgi:lantibiotic modifying enzyme